MTKRAPLRTQTVWNGAFGGYVYVRKRNPVMPIPRWLECGMFAAETPALASFVG